MATKKRDFKNPGQSVHAHALNSPIRKAHNAHMQAGEGSLI